MFSQFCIVLLIVNIFGDVSALVELPQVEDNNILEADTAIRQTTNKLFSLLKLKVNKERPTLKQYSLIHNYLVSNSLHDYTNLIEIAKLTRVDKTKLSNETRNFMTDVNEILNEDVNHDKETEDKYVIRLIEGFLTNFDKHTDTYSYNENNADYKITEILKILEKNTTFWEAYNNISDPDTSWLQSSEENDHIIDDNEFWVPTARRIFQGKKTKINDFPFIASIQIFNLFQCAGSIIKSDIIITAASCLQLTWNNRFFRENPGFLTARVGSTFHNAGGEIIPVLEIYFHPDFEPKTLKHNICLLRLHRQLVFKKNSGKRLKKIELDRKPNPLPTISYGQEGIDITIVGWGAKSPNNIIKDPFLSYAVLDIYPIKECQAVYSADFVTQKHFCAGFVSRGGGACNRDIGGPGILYGVLVGVVSFGSPTCGTPNAPTVFTKLGYYADWIDSILGKKVPSANSRTTSTLSPFHFLSMYSGYEKLNFTSKPIPSTRKPKETENMDALRILKEKGLLKVLINTMIGSDEAKSLLREAEKKAASREVQIVQHMQVSYIPTTTTEPALRTTGTISKNKNYYTGITPKYKKFAESSSEASEETIELTSDKTFANENVDEDEYIIDTQIEKDILALIENLKMEKLLNETFKANDFNKLKDQTDVKKLRDDNEKNKNDEILKITYKDRDERDYTSSSSSENSDSNDNLLNISVIEKFNDLTYRNNDTAPDVFISRQELLELVSETLKEDLHNKTRVALSGAPKNVSPKKSTLKKRTTKKKIIRKNPPKNPVPKNAKPQVITKNNNNKQ